VEKQLPTREDGTVAGGLVLINVSTIHSNDGGNARVEDDQAAKPSHEEWDTADVWREHSKLGTIMFTFSANRRPGSWRRTIQRQQCL
jgi:hypothetical protein